jgi:GT2 family glycosyltransferase
MLLNSWYLAQHGYMDERYFLYSEEPDLALRLKKPFKIRIIVDALVFHKGGASTGSARPLRQRSLGSEYYSLRSRMLLARKMGLPMFGLSICFAFFQVARRMFSSPAHFFNSAIAIIDGIRNKGGRRF